VQGLPGFVLGSALQLQQAELWDWSIYAALFCGSLVLHALLVLKIKATHLRRIVSIALLSALGFGSTGIRAVVYMHTALPSDMEGRDVRVLAVVASLPQHNESGVRFRLYIESAQLDGHIVQVPQLIDVGWYGGAYVQSDALLGLNRLPQEVRAGERWEMTLRLKAPHGTRNPNGFDYELWLWEQGVQATAYVRAGAKDVAPLRREQTWQYPVTLVRQIVRDRITAQVEKRQFAGWLAALVVGDQQAIERADWDVFRATGVAHLVSISGLHITMFAWVAVMVVRRLWRLSPALCLALPAPTAAWVAGVVLATLYAVFSGWGLPAQRTCLMLATMAVLRISGVRWPWMQIWMLACAVVVAWDPWALLQAGFWLSFVAVAILFATDTAQENPKAGLRGLLWSNLREQWVITVALTPLTLLLFGQISIVGLAANALAIPWVTLVITPLAMLGTFIPALWDVAAWAAQGLFVYLQFLAALPWATWSIATPALWAAILGVCGGFFLVMPWPWYGRSLGVPLLLPVLMWQAPLPPKGHFEILVPDIGQGNAVLVRTAHHALLYDAGPRYSLESDAGHRVLVPLLQSLQTQLDTVVLSHRDLDHVGGAAAVLAMQPQANLLSSIEASHPLQALRSAQACVAGQTWEWDGVQFSVLHPSRGDYQLSRKSNAMSCVVRVQAASHSALLVGDIEQAQEASLVAQGAALQADWLLVPHHGSKTSSSDSFLDAVSPSIAVVQAGYRNRFGHPASVVLQRYQNRGIMLVDSPHCGAYTWQSWAPQNSACARVQGRRYWHHTVP
jgi:competence protein ComEC